MQNMTSRCHSGMHEFIQVLLDLQAEMIRKFVNNITNGADGDKPSKKLQEKHSNILKFSDKLVNCTIGRNNFLFGISQNINS